MAISTFPLNGIEYSAADFSSFFCTRTSGVYAADNFGITVTGSDMQATIGSGMAWMKLSPTSGIAVKNDSNTVLTFDTPDPTYPRYDVVALQFSAQQLGTVLKIIKGQASSTPLMPTPSRTQNLYELYLYAIYRKPGASVIARSNVNDLRYNETYCGLMSDGVKSIPTQVLHDQYYAMLKELQEAGGGYGVCNTAAKVKAKEVAIPNFALQPGAMIAVLFKAGNSASEPTLNVNATGAKPIYNCYRNAFIAATDIGTKMTAQLVYNGERWVLLNPMPA